MRRTTLGLAALAAAISCTTIARAQYPQMFPYADAPAQVATPSDNRPTPVGDPVAQARNNVNAAEARVAELKKQLDHDKEQMTTIQSRLSGGEAGLAELNKDLSQAAAELKERNKAYNDAAARYQAARGALEQAMADAGRPVGTTEPSRNAADAVAAAKDQVHLAESAATQRLAASQEYHVAYKNWEDAQQRVQTLRAKLAPDAPQLKQAVADCQAARQKVEELRDRTIDNDAAVRPARIKLAQAESAADAQRLGDPKTLPSAPAVVRAQADLREAKGRFDAASTQLQAAEQNLAAAQRKVQRQMEGLAGDRKTLESLQDQVATLPNDLNRAQADARAAKDRMQQAMALAAAQPSAQPAPANDYYGPPQAGPDVQYAPPPATYDLPPAVVVYPPVVYDPPPVVYDYPADYYGPFFRARIDIGGFDRHRIYSGDHYYGGYRSYGYRSGPAYSYHRSYGDPYSRYSGGDRRLAPSRHR